MLKEHNLGGEILTEIQHTPWQHITEPTTAAKVPSKAERAFKLYMVRMVGSYQEKIKKGIYDKTRMVSETEYYTLPIFLKFIYLFIYFLIGLIFGHFIALYCILL